MSKHKISRSIATLNGFCTDVAMLGVDPKSQGLGAGSKLMTVLGDRIRAEDGNRAIVLETGEYLIPSPCSPCTS